MTVQPYDVSFDATFNFSRITMGSSLSGLTIGKSGNSTAITVDAATSIAGPISIYGGAITLNAGLTATGNNTITLQGSGATTDGASGFVNGHRREFVDLSEQWRIDFRDSGGYQRHLRLRRGQHWYQNR